MDTTPHLARRFPLVARPRPACAPLDKRVGELVRLADTVGHDVAQVSAVLNQAALLASDVGLADLARTWCHQHAHARFKRLPDGAREAIGALEPVVNLARLRIRDGDGDGALCLLEKLFTSICEHVDVVVDEDLLVPCSRLTGNEEDHQEVRRWLWMVLLADGTRAMVAAGQWSAALEHLQSYKGIGTRMSDGRQVAVITHATSGNTGQALELLENTTPGEPWEEAVTSVLTVMCHDQPTPEALDRMLTSYGKVTWSETTAVFHARLGLAVLDVLGPGHPQTEVKRADLLVWVLAGGNGYCARELVEGIPPTVLGEAGTRLAALVSECGLGVGALPQHLEDPLDAAVQNVLRRL